MNLEVLKSRWETLEGEQLKNVAEFSLHTLAKSRLGRSALHLAQGGERIEDARLNTYVGGLLLENPIMVGAGWDKKGRCVDGLYELGFAGTEVGTVLSFSQPGNPKPRLKYKDGKAINRLGFNSPGQDIVKENLLSQLGLGVIGISVGKNKNLPDKYAPWAHANVIENLHQNADYFAINLSTPNTPGLRGLLQPEPLEEIILASKEVLKDKGVKPLFVKTTVDLSLENLDKVLGVCLELGVSGVIDSNTTIDNELKKLSGWAGEAGGLSGDDFIYRQRANERMKHITRQTWGTSLQRIGVGGINKAKHVIERIESGAQAVQVVTGIRQRKAKIANNINKGILARLERDGLSSVEELIGVNI